MKIAVLVAGMYREFELAVKSWKFLNDPRFDCDIYFSTWSTTYEDNEALGIDIHEDVTIDRINQVVNVFKHDISPPYLDDGSTCNGDKMFNRWTVAIELLKNSGIEYDAAILLRPDVFIDVNINEFFANISSLQEAEFQTPGGIFGYKNEVGESKFGINDWAIVAKPNTMCLMADFKNRYAITDIHNWLFDWFRSHGRVKHIRGVGQNCIIRSLSRTTGAFDYETFNEDAKKWWSARYDGNYG